MLRKRALVFLLLSVVLLVSLPATAAAAPVPTDPAVLKALAAARAATARYHDVANALADGYVPASPCEPAMGVHYVNFGLAFDFSVNPLTPEMLLYVPTEAGPRLVGVEYAMVAWVVTPGGPAPWFDPAPPPFPWFFPSPPTIFGQTMDGPMAPHEVGVDPWHYELHVWLWQANPSGIFAEFNPNVSCD